MQAMGRLGGYISRSVSNVSGTFHPFSGSVDVIVVEQPDGSFKSSPWYVRFGKFQGVLKTREKVVGITVNGVEADFHMYLDSRGEAYFLKEVDVEEGKSTCSPPSSPGKDMDGQPVNGLSLKSESFNYDSNFSDSIIIETKSVNRISSLSYRRLGLIFGSRRSMKVERIQNEENATDVVRTDSLERAEIAADLLELNWSTNLSSSLLKKDTVDNSNPVADDCSNTDCCSHIKTSSLSNTRYQDLESTVDDGSEKCLTSESTVETAVSVGSAGEANIPGTHKSMVDKFGLDGSEFGVSSVNLSNTSCVNEDRAEENVPYHAKEERPVVGLEGHGGPSNSSFCYSEYGGVSFLARPVQDTAEERYLRKPGQERDLGHSREPLDKEGCLEEQGELAFIHEEEMLVNGETIEDASESLGTECYSEKLVSIHQSNDSFKVKSQNVASLSPFEERKVSEDMHMQGSLVVPSSLGAQISECELLPPYNQESIIMKEHCLLSDLDDFGSTYAKDSELKYADLEGKETGSSCSPIVKFGRNESNKAKWSSMLSLDQSVINDHVCEEELGRRRLRSIASEICINRTDNTGTEELTAISRSLPNMGPLSHNFVESNTGSVVASGTNSNHISADLQAMDPDDGILLESKEEPSNPSIGNSLSHIGSLEGSPRRTWSLSFKRSNSKNLSHMETSFGKNTESIEKSTALEGGKDEIKVNISKKFVRALIPTSEQLAALNLKQGKNLVAFTFSTAMLGKQQVDAHIFLWRWDTRIVISDVDGTITRSDVLGQFMPLVGRDWSQSGVAHLFTAIKENGYELLFLSARSIAQSFLTRQFLFNIKQDGKALPEGPVVISPDGLFPSLFREVIRRAPHEFKVACLEDIKALFPADRNPFYAGFGNRDTDEFSYLKVGIPRGKIFIINPKGEIVVNRHIDTKSYLSLHSLVHDMFPTILSSEEFQEDFNSWNYWKLRPAIID